GPQRISADPIGVIALGKNPDFVEAGLRETSPSLGIDKEGGEDGAPGRLDQFPAQASLKRRGLRQRFEDHELSGVPVKCISVCGTRSLQLAGSSSRFSVRHDVANLDLKLLIEHIAP